jgi:hypothetical protein
VPALGLILRGVILPDSQGKAATEAMSDIQTLLLILDAADSHGGGFNKSTKFTAPKDRPSLSAQAPENESKSP